MTGMYQTTIGAHNHRSHRDDGYRSPDGRPAPDRLAPRRRLLHGQRPPLPAADRASRGRPRPTGTSPRPPKPFDSDRWVDLKAHQPFYAQVNFQETHRAFHAPKVADPAKVEVPPYEPDHPVTRPTARRTSTPTAELDRKVGVILDRLEADGLADSDGRRLLRRQRPGPHPGQAVLLRGGAERPADHPLAEGVPRPRALPAGHGGRPPPDVDRPGPDDARARRGPDPAEDAGPPVPRRPRRAAPASTSSGPATAATRRPSGSGPSATPAIATSATSRPTGRSSRPTSTRRSRTRPGTS